MPCGGTYKLYNTILLSNQIIVYKSIKRILGYHTYPAPKPTVQTIKVKTLEQVNYLVGELKSCDMLVYFHRPYDLQSYKYTQVFKNYIVHKTLPVFYRSNTANYINNINGYYEIRIRGLPMVYLCRRQSNEDNHDDVIVRLEMVPLTAGEIWFFRLLLLHTSPNSFEDAKRINGTMYGSYQAAAVAAGIVTDANVASECFQQSIGFATPAALRGLFATLTIQGYATLQIYNDMNMRHLLCQDWLEVGTPRMNADQANNCFLLDLQQRLKREDKSLIMFGFPQPLEQHTELERHRLLYNHEEQQQLFEQLDIQFPNNDDQQIVYDTIMDAVTNPSQNKRHFFIDGPGGTGKTTIVKKI